MDKPPKLPTKTHLLEIANFVYDRYQKKIKDEYLNVANTDEIIEMRTNHDNNKS